MSPILGNESPNVWLPTHTGYKVHLVDVSRRADNKTWGHCGKLLNTDDRSERYTRAARHAVHNDEHCKICERYVEMQ